MLEDKCGMPQALHKGTDFNMASSCVPCKSSHLVDADGLRGSDKRTAAEAQLVFELEDDSVYLIACKPVYTIIIVFHRIQVMFDIDVYSTIREARVVGYPAGRNGSFCIAGILKKLLKGLASVKKARFSLR
jgi:hypothetical protein